jgi:hypothetical protein
MSDNKVVSHEEVIGSKGASIQIDPKDLPAPPAAAFAVD